MKWNKLEDENQLDEVVNASYKNPILIYKHSTRCNISSMVLNQLEKDWEPEQLSHVSPYFLDLIQFRPLSDAVSEKFNVQHQSPQILIIKNGECIYNASHMGIEVDKIIKHTQEAKV